MIDIPQAAVLIAGTLVASHYAGPAWKVVSVHAPRLAARFRKAKTDVQLTADEAVAQADAIYEKVAKQYPNIINRLHKAEKDAIMIADVVQQKLAALGRALADHKSQIADLTGQLAASKAETEASNAHLAEVTAELDAVKANLADTESAVSALADQAGA